MSGRLRVIVGVCFSLVSVLWVSFVWFSGSVETLAQGQTQTTFTGNSFRVDSEGVRLSRRGFDASARSHWHVHGADQLLFVQQGRMRYQAEGGRMQEIDLHESAYLTGGVAHWQAAVEAVGRAEPGHGQRVDFGVGVAAAVHAARRRHRRVQYSS